MDTDRRLHRVFKSINRPLTMMGVERRLFFFSVITGACTFNLFDSMLAGILVFILMYVFALWSTKNDPQYLRILLNSQKFKRQYCPMKFHPVGVVRVKTDD